jgi:hypothetical protein
MSGKRREIVRFDLDRAVTSRYERSETAAAIAAYERLVDANALSYKLTNLAMDNGMLSKNDDFTRGGNHESGHHR